MKTGLFGFKLSEDEKAKLRKLAESERRTMGNYLRNLIEDAYEAHKKEADLCQKVG